MMKDKQNLIGIMAAANLALVLGVGYVALSMRDSLTDRITKIETSTIESSTQEQEQSSANAKKMAKVFSDLDEMKESLGATTAELKRARETAQTLKRQHDNTVKEMASRLAEKASSSDIDGLRQETSTKLAAAQQDSNTKIGDVSGEVMGLKKDLASTRDDWGRALVDVKDVLSERIAKN